MVKIAIGPETKYHATWKWIGFDLARELSKYFEIEIFKVGEIPKSEIVILIKQQTELDGKKVIYFPCDYYETEEQMSNDEFLKKCSHVCCQSIELFNEVRKYNLKCSVVGHNLKYALPTMNSYRKDGILLWVGHSKYIKYLTEWLIANPTNLETVILTDLPYKEAIPGDIYQFKWTSKLQNEMMRIARLGIDIKGEDFNQKNRSGHKLESYIASGIPSVCNKSSISEEFKHYGFEILEPNNTKVFSKDYYNETVEFGKFLREKNSLESIGLKVKNIVDTV